MRSGMWRLSRSARFACACACVLVVRAHAQTPAPLAAPDLPLGIVGSVSALALQPDGGLVFGGSFTMVDGVARRNIARLTPNGMLDLNWNPSANGEVDVLATDTLGNVYAGGRFTEIGGQPRNVLAKLGGHGDGAAIREWNAQVVGGSDDAGPIVSALATTADGAIFVGGDFHSIGGGAHDYLAKLAGTTGAADALWDTSPDGSVSALAADTSGAIFVAWHGIGLFDLLIQKLSTSGRGLPVADWQPASIVGTADLLAVDPEGTLYAAGVFISGQGDHRSLVRFPRSGRGRIDVDWKPDPPYGYATALTVNGINEVYTGHPGGIARWSTARSTTTPQWSIEADDAVTAIVAGIRGPVVAAGRFGTLGGQGVLGLARLGTGGGIPSAVVSVESPGKVNAIAHTSDGGMVVGGQFARAGTAARRNILRLDARGELDPHWDPGATEEVAALAVDASDRVYVAAAHPWNDSAPVHLTRVSEGQIDPAWSAAVFGEVGVLAIAPDAPGGIYVGGSFSFVGDVARSCVARLLPLDGAVDPTWDAGANARVDAITVDGSGAVYLGGILGEYGDPSRPPIARLSGTTGQLDRTWSPPVPGEVEAIAIARDGSHVYAATDLPGSEPAEESHRVVRIGSDGALDPEWIVNSDGAVHALAVDDSGAVYAGGSFTRLGEQLRAFIGRIAGSTATVDPYWAPSPDAPVAAIATDSDGRVHIGGAFTSIGGQPRGGIADLPSPSMRGHSRHALPPLVPPRPTPSPERLR